MDRKRYVLPDPRKKPDRQPLTPPEKIVEAIEKDMGMPVVKKDRNGKYRKAEGR